MPPKAVKKAPAKKTAKAKGKSSPAKAAKAPAKRGSAVQHKTPDPDRKKHIRRAVDASGSWPVDPETGLPLVQLSFTASELVPTGEYANVIVGPVTVTKFILDPGDDQALADELNDLAEVVEADCISVQRTLVLESLQDEVSD